MFLDENEEGSVGQLLSVNVYLELLLQEPIKRTSRYK